MEGIAVIGGGGAGLTAALAAKKAGASDITLITKDKYSYSPCALPFVLGGEIESFDKMTSAIEDICRMSGIKCVISPAEGVDTKRKTVKTKTGEIPYGKLIIASGGSPAVPPIKGANLQGVYNLHRLEDGEKVLAAMKDAKNAVVVGGGAIGLESAAAFVEKGIKVTLIEGLEYVLCRLFDPDYCDMIEKNLQDRGIELIKGKFIEEIAGDTQVKSVKVAGREIPADLVILSTGVRPNVKILENSGIELLNGGIKTDEHCETSMKGVYAAGDCSITKSILTGKPIASLLGTTAVRQGMVAGMNAAGEHAVFEGVLNSMLLKIFDQEIGRCGLTEKDAKAEGMEVVTGKIKSSSIAEYYPGGKPMELKLIFNAKDKLLVGAQVIGGAGVPEKVNSLTFALSKKTTVEDLTRMEYAYTPPLAPSHNAIVLAAENAHRKIKRLEERDRRRN
ncbi:MAG: FAD-dependent oxidoreductase [Candidatus Altiarchaeia archaeon]